MSFGLPEQETSPMRKKEILFWPCNKEGSHLKVEIAHWLKIFNKACTLYRPLNRFSGSCGLFIAKFNRLVNTNILTKIQNHGKNMSLHRGHVIPIRNQNQTRVGSHEKSPNVKSSNDESRREI